MSQRIRKSDRPDKYKSLELSKKAEGQMPGRWYYESC